MDNESTLTPSAEAVTEQIREEPEIPTQETDEVYAQEPSDAPDATEVEPGVDALPTDYERLAEEDLAALKEQFPALCDMTSLGELENPARYGALRELGLSVREAYLATTTPKERAASPYDNRSHLRSAVSRTHGGTGEQLSAQQMRAARELFSGISDSEIRQLYKRVTK